MPAQSLSLWRTGRSALAPRIKGGLGRLSVLGALHRPVMKGQAIIVAFHSIVRGASDGALRCGVDDFDAYCRFFARHMRVCTLTELAAAVRAGEPPGGRLVITFDDGYADNHELAGPVLERYGLPATFFVSTGFIGSEHQTDWDKSVGVRSRWMTVDQVRALHAAGHEIGAHTRTHCDLGAVPAEEGYAEIAGSVDDIQAWTGQRPRHFAIPYGRAFPELERVSRFVLEDLGLETITLCRGGLMNPGRQPHVWERIPVSPIDYLSPYGWFCDVVRDAVASR